MLLQPTSSQMNAMERYIQSMSAESYAMDDEPYFVCHTCRILMNIRSPKGFLWERHVVNPEYHRVYEMIRHRVLHPDAKELPEPDSVLVHEFDVPATFKAEAINTWRELKSAFIVRQGSLDAIVCYSILRFYS